MAADTIFALSSGAPPAAIAVVRVSGPMAGAALDTLAGLPRPAPRYATRRTLRDPAGEALDDALVLWFPGPGSASGEDVAELHLHGARAVVAAVGAALATLSDTRPAEAGEFTRRALLNGRIDLSQAEGLANLLVAETEAQRRAALRSAEGGVGREVGGWLARLTAVAATIEAELDYADEADVVAAVADVRLPLVELANDIAAALARPPIERLHDGFRVVLAGPPNAGKSSLINVMTEREVSIVTSVAGTTRDVVEASVIRDGRPFLFSDTAGLVETSDDPIELIGVDRARATIAGADLVLWLGDDPPSLPALWLYPRADVRADAPTDRLAVSIFSQESIAALWNEISRAADVAAPVDTLQLYNRRQRDRAGETLEAIGRATLARDPLIAAEDVRMARRALGRLLGYEEVEAVLDALFATFCVGK